VDANYILAWLVGIGAVLTALRTRGRSEIELRTLFWCAILILAALSVGALFLPSVIGYLVFLPWLFGIILQQILLSKVIMLFEEGELERLSKLLHRVSLVPLFRIWGHLWKKLIFIEKSFSFEISQSEQEMLLQIATTPSFVAIYARARLLFFSQAWDELEKFSRVILEDGARRYSPFFMQMRLLALLFQGRRDVFEEVLQRYMTTLPSQASRERMVRCLRSYAPEELHSALFASVNVSVKDDSALSQGMPLGVQIILGILLSGFFAQLLFGHERVLSLFAFDPYLIIVYDQWWRLLTCGLVHAGGLHFLSNSLGIFLLGPFLARYMGNIRFLSFFILAVIGASLWMLMLMWFSLIDPKPMIGASGGVMGLVGGYFSFYIISYWKSGSLYHREQLKSVLVIIALQTLFDISTPQVSFLAHFGGLLSGISLFFFTSLFSRRVWEKDS